MSASTLALKQDSLKLLKQYNLLRKQGSPRSIKVRNKIVALNLGLVYGVAERMAWNCLEPEEDLISIGSIGLIRATERYDVSKGIAFSSFAVPFIRGEIMHFLRDDWAVGPKIPRKAWEERATVAKAHRRMIELGIEGTLEQSAACCGISKEKWREIEEMTSLGATVSIDADDGLDFPDNREINGDEIDLHKAIATLPSLFQRVIMLRFVHGYETSKIAAKEEIDQEECGAIIEKALDRLHKRLGRKGISANNTATA